MTTASPQFTEEQNKSFSLSLNDNHAKIEAWIAPIKNLLSQMEGDDPKGVLRGWGRLPALAPAPLLIGEVKECLEGFGNGVKSNAHILLQKEVTGHFCEKGADEGLNSFLRTLGALETFTQNGRNKHLVDLRSLQEKIACAGEALVEREGSGREVVLKIGRRLKTFLDQHSAAFRQGPTCSGAVNADGLFVATLAYPKVGPKDVGLT